MPPCGGTLNEFSCHYLDLLHGYAGALPHTISCDGGHQLVFHDGRDTWDRATVTMKYPTMLCRAYAQHVRPSRADLTIMGDEGSIETIVICSASQSIRRKARKAATVFRRLKRMNL